MYLQNPQKGNSLISYSQSKKKEGQSHSDSWYWSCHVKNLKSKPYFIFFDTETTRLPKEFKDAHDAMADVTATEACFEELLCQDVIRIAGYNYQINNG